MELFPENPTDNKAFIEFQAQNYQEFRKMAPYIAMHRGSIVVIHIPGEIMMKIDRDEGEDNHYREDDSFDDEEEEDIVIGNNNNNNQDVGTSTSTTTTTTTTSQKKEKRKLVTK